MWRINFELERDNKNDKALKGLDKYIDVFPSTVVN